ncbi:hypothetical protein [Streptomyces sp. NPDC004134]|uniref:hypothetical protein n=1 Tax=Streptomyces sp. NPDC004134 TaxID=3364691 RepID=UPI0036840141
MTTTPTPPAAQEHADVPGWPVYGLTVHGDGRVLASGPLVTTSGHPTRAAAVAAVAGAAAWLGRPVRARATEADGAVWHLVISPEGAVSGVPDGGRATAQQKRRAKRAAKAIAGEPAAAGADAAGPGAQAEPEAYAAFLAQVRDHLEAGRVDEAAVLAARLDELAALRLGVSHPDALRIREIRARVVALAGDALGGIRLYRDVAERWHYRKDGERAETIASRAETLWLQIGRREQALAAGDEVIRMRRELPGRAGEALAAVLEHQAWLTQAQDARAAERPALPAADSHPSRRPAPEPAPPAPRRPEPAVGSPAGARPEPAVDAPAPALPEPAVDAPAVEAPARHHRRPRTVPSWERPAVHARSAG